MEISLASGSVLIRPWGPKRRPAGGGPSPQGGVQKRLRAGRVPRPKVVPHVLRPSAGAARTWLGSGPGLGLGLLLWLRLRRRGWSGCLLGVGGSVPMQARGSGDAPALHTRSKGTRARARVRIATVRSLRAIGARRAAVACWQHSGTATTQHACTWRLIQAAGARRSRATGLSLGMNSRASQRAGELAGAAPANRAPLAHPRQLAGRSSGRGYGARGARFGGGLETVHLNGRPGGREATRCAPVRRPLRGAGEHQSIGHPG